MFSARTRHAVPGGVWRRFAERLMAANLRLNHPLVFTSLFITALPVVLVWLGMPGDRKGLLADHGQPLQTV